MTIIRDDCPDHGSADCLVATTKPTDKPTGHALAPALLSLSDHDQEFARSHLRDHFPYPEIQTRLLLIAEEAELAENLRDYLEPAGFIVYSSSNIDEAMGLARSYPFDLVIFDTDLIASEDTHILPELHQAHPDTPMIVISADSDVQQKIAMLARGADDYLTKPLHPAELLARIHVILRRQRTSDPKSITIGPLSLDLESRRAFVNGRDVRLTAKEYSCLELLASRQGMTITKEMFLQHLYSGRDEPEMKIIDVFVCKVRRKLRQAGADNLIETVWGRGYVIHPRD